MDATEFEDRKQAVLEECAVAPGIFQQVQRRLEEFLERIEVDGQSQLFRELLRLDFDYRGRKGTAINQVLEHHPDLISGHNSFNDTKCKLVKA